MVIAAGGYQPFRKTVAMPTAQIDHFSDILCVWAYASQSNFDRLTAEFGDRITINIHFCSVFPDTWTKIASQWTDRGGFDGYANHVQGIAGKFENLPIHSDTWAKTRPRSSASPHLFIKAVELIEQEGFISKAPVAERPSILAARELRSAFFTRAEDVSDWDVQREIAGLLHVDFDNILNKLKTGEAIARLTKDYDLAQLHGIEGSPTYVINEGRQKLFGNVSYGVIAANVHEMLASQGVDAASLC
ncbi:DsbA family protein [uncultured Parasphingorhabdus sp.]|uniref:DsbA family oxidoreductase n=1 Tax=uncultured Parasphingorhabdus sp. TaxID=2709694 RepID=UPI0030D75832